MKNISLIIFFSLIIFSCKKKEEESNSCSTCSSGNGTEPTGFYYNINGGGTISADSATYNVTNKTITAHHQGATRHINIKTSSQITGTYGFTTTANTFSYTESLGTYYATGGYINITANANNKLSGNFTSNGSGGTFATISGNFKDIPKR